MNNIREEDITALILYNNFVNDQYLNLKTIIFVKMLFNSLWIQNYEKYLLFRMLKIYKD